MQKLITRIFNKLMSDNKKQIHKSGDDYPPNSRYSPPDMVNDHFVDTHVDIHYGSVIGRSHLARSLYRDDAVAFRIFQVDEINFYVLAISDGIGSLESSRYSSAYSVNYVSDYLMENLDINFILDKNCNRLQLLFDDSVVRMYDEFTSYVSKNKFITEYGCTLLFVLYSPELEFLGVAQTGDGFISALDKNNQLRLLVRPVYPDLTRSGVYSITEKNSLSFSRYSFLFEKEVTSLKSIFIASDGVEEDVYPMKEWCVAIENNFRGNYSPLSFIKWLRRNEGSADDRTLGVLLFKDGTRNAY